MGKIKMTIGAVALEAELFDTPTGEDAAEDRFQQQPRAEHAAGDILCFAGWNIIYKRLS